MHWECGGALHSKNLNWEGENIFWMGGHHKHFVKERVHSEMKTFKRLDYCPHNIDFFQKCSNFLQLCFRLQNLHIRGPASHHPWTCIAPFADLHHTIHGPASHHSWTCITPSVDLHKNILTRIRPSGPASFYRNLSGQLKKKAEKNQYN